MTLVPELSRSFQAEQHCRKRKRDSPCCFQVRACPQGIGMFAVRDISCGSLILESQDPLISTHRSSDCKLFCHACVTPLQNLKQHVLFDMKTTDDATNNPADSLDPPFLEQMGGLQFTDQLVECVICAQVAWCGHECAERDKPRHQFLCSKDSSSDGPFGVLLEEFFQTVDQSTIFELAVDAVSVILASVLSESSQPEPSEDKDRYSFWQDYGSHPLWWEVGDPKGGNKRQQNTQTFVNLLQKGLEEKCRSVPRLQSALRQVCTLDHMGQLLGMLQCNVMEFEFPSPLEQYREHLEQLCQEDQNKDSILAQQWLEKHPVLDGHSPPPCTLGSGLYPLLTLANHDCDPNASIDFLSESNRGSMVALRDICKGQEICITYVPNGGDWDAGGTCERFRHFQPTRTWRFLNPPPVTTSDPEEEESENWNDEDEEDSGNEDSTGISGDELESNEAEEDKEECVECCSPKDRAVALLEYGFHCQCRRCLHERSESVVPYDRDCSN